MDLHHTEPVPNFWVSTYNGTLNYVSGLARHRHVIVLHMGVGEAPLCNAKSKCKTLVHGHQRASTSSGLFRKACVRILCTLI